MKVRLYLLVPMLLVLGAGQTLAQSQAQAYQRMNNELQALGKLHQQRVAALHDKFRQDMQAATSGDERAAIQQRYQSDMRNLLQETSEKNRAIRQGYQQQLRSGQQGSTVTQTPAAAGKESDSAARNRQMNAELQALGLDYLQRIAELGSRFKQDMREANSTEERTTLQRAYQEKIRALQQEAQAETLAIRQHYLGQQ